MFGNLIFYGIIGLAAAGLPRSRRFQEANILNATAESLAIIRIITSVVMLFFLLGENYPSLSLIPREAVIPKDPFAWFLQIPAFAQWHLHPVFLHGLNTVTLIALGGAAVGWRSRASTLVGGLGCLLLGGIARQYTPFVHPGLIPMEVLLVLGFTPCGDALSLDRRKQKEMPRHSAETYGWSRFACWCVAALPYTAAALSKLESGNLDWLRADSLLCYLLMDSLPKDGFNFDGGLWLIHAPAGLITGLASGALAIELSAILLLFSPRARRIVPWLLILLHIGILIFQNVAFFDLMFMPLIFIDWRKGTQPVAKPAAAPTRGLKVLALVAVLFVLAPWKHRLELYPLTAWTMYSDAQLSGTTFYPTATAILASGTEIPFDLGRYITVFHRSYGRMTLRALAFNPEKNAGCGRLLARCAELHHRATGEAITAIVVERKTWNFREDPDDPERGKVTESMKFSLLPPRAK